MGPAGTPPEQPSARCRAARPPRRRRRNRRKPLFTCFLKDVCKRKPVDVRRCYSHKANSTAWPCCADDHNVAVAAVPLQIRDNIMHCIPSDDCVPLVVVTGPLKRKRTACRPLDGRSPPPFSSTQFRFRCSPFRMDTVNQMLRSQWCIQICRTSSGRSPVAKCFESLCFWVRAGTFLARGALGISAVVDYLEVQPSRHKPSGTSCTTRGGNKSQRSEYNWTAPVFLIVHILINNSREHWTCACNYQSASPHREFPLVGLVVRKVKNGTSVS